MNDQKEFYVADDRVFILSRKTVVDAVVSSVFEHDEAEMYRVSFTDADGQQSSACYAAFNLAVRS